MYNYLRVNQTINEIYLLLSLVYVDREKYSPKKMDRASKNVEDH